MKSKQWHPRVICADCGTSYQTPFEHFLPETCSECGAVRDERWRLVQMRWVPATLWWRPSTWRQGYWEIAEETLPDGFKIHDGSGRVATDHGSKQRKPSSSKRLAGRLMGRFTRRGPRS